jgi:hypothetical protein
VRARSALRVAGAVISSRYRYDLRAVLRCYRRQATRGARAGGGRYGSPVGVPWGEIVPDGIGAFGVAVAGAAAWLSQRASSGSIDVSKTMAAIEQDRRNSERLPRLSARLESWGSGQSGFGVGSKLPAVLEAEGIRPAWQTDTLHPLADWTERMPPGTSALWLMELRRSARTSAGADGVRFKMLAWAERDDQHWEFPLPVSITDNARAVINEEASQSGR